MTERYFPPTPVILKTDQHCKLVNLAQFMAKNIYSWELNKEQITLFTAQYVPCSKTDTRNRMIKTSDKYYQKIGFSYLIGEKYI